MVYGGSRPATAGGRGQSPPQQIVKGKLNDNDHFTG